ncbi:MAG: SDR family oxidoreductase [Candidatus Fermentibacteraceae bacterium]|nr:SDR family oxidoreductase [Candidatus Fermentibacteraceae bacterium]MBN2607898.1 SDR family oxidoreductase [Candidatus Fermentibacteraceae bacterium]
MNDDPVLITGATGFLGGFLAGELVRRGKRTFLAAGPQAGAVDRIRRLLEFLDVTPKYSPKVFSSDITKPGLGLCPEDARALDTIREVIHCAALTSFSHRERARLEAVNIDGTANILDAVPACRRFYHMSTAYVAGKASGTCMEEPVSTRCFNNHYEATKKKAEDVAMHVCQGRNIDLTIFRPSITCGDSRTGRSTRFNALYYPVRVMLFLRDTIRKDILERDGSRAYSLGASMDPSGRVRLPVSLPGAGRINVIPVNYLVQAVIAVMESGATGIFHLVNPRENTVGELASFTEDFYGITGISISRELEADGPLQALVNSYMKVYYPYFCDGRSFDRKRSDRVLLNEGLVCPSLNREVFKVCMDFAIEMDWGARTEF